MSGNTIKKIMLNQFGDTIIEVMIVLAVLGLAIGISYSTASRSLLNARQAQENSHAAELVQSQVEELRTMTGNISTDPNYIYRAGGFCIFNGNTVSPLGGTDPTDYSIFPIGSPCVMDGLYHIAISYDGTTDNFQVQAAWDDVLGQGQDTVTLIYRLHKPL